MASIVLSGILLDPNSDLAVGDQVRLTHESTTGQTLPSAQSLITIDPTGSYYIELQYGLVLVEYKDVRKQQFKNLGVVTVNSDNTATTLPALLNAIVPPTNPQLLQFQAILADAEAAKDLAEAAAVQITTVQLISSTATYGAQQVVATSGYVSSGDGGGVGWKQTGVTGQTVSQAPLLNAGKLTDGNGNEWEIVSGGTVPLSAFGGLTQAYATAALTYCVPNNIPIDFSKANIDITLLMPSIASSLQVGVDYAYLCVQAQGKVIDILIDAGHALVSGIAVQDGDYGNIKISSVDAVVAVVAPFSSGTLVVTYARAPILNCLVDQGNSTSFDSYTVTQGSVGHVLAGGGVKNGVRGAYANKGSQIDITSSVFTGFQQAGLHVSRNSKCEANFAVISGNSQDALNNFGSIYASRASQIHGSSIDSSGSGGHGVRAQRGAVISVPNVNVSGAVKTALIAVSKASIYSGADAPIMLNLGAEAIIAQNGAVIVIDSSVITLDGTSTDVAIEAINGAKVDIGSSTISGHAGINCRAVGAGSSIEASSSTVTGGLGAFIAERGATIDATLATVTGQTGNGALSKRGANIILIQASVTGSTTNDLAVEDGGYMSAKGCTTTNGAGSPAIADTNMANGFGFVNNGDRGLMWA